LEVSGIEIDEDCAWELGSGALAYAGAHGEDLEEVGVGAELGGATVVDLPPELAVALVAGGELGFGEAVGVGWHGVARRKLDRLEARNNKGETATHRQRFGDDTS